MSEIQPGTVIEGYEFMEPIGRGGFSKVYRVRSIQFNRLFVAKVAFVKSDENREQVLAAFDIEIKSLSRLNHPNIINLYQHFVIGNDFFMILEHCRNGSLWDYIQRNGPMRGPLLAQSMKETCSALRFAWSRGVFHRDIKPQNILLDDNFHVKLADFGISILEGKGRLVKDFSGSVAFAAPEMMEHWVHDPIQTDVWALGVTLLTLLVGNVPWGTSDFKPIMDMVLGQTWRIPDTVIGGWRTIVEGMLQFSPDARVMPTEETIDKLDESVRTGIKTAGSLKLPVLRVPRLGKGYVPQKCSSIRMGVIMPLAAHRQKTAVRL